MFDFFLQSVLFIYNTVGFQNLGVAIIEIAFLTRIIFYPFLKQQTHYSKKMADLQPHLSALKDKHKDNKQAFAQAQMALFKEHGINPAAGCLPSIVQIVVLIGLFNALSKILTMNLNTHFLIWDMAKPDAFHFPNLPFALPGILVALAALTQFIQTKQMMPAAPSSDKKDDMAEAQSMMVWMFPLMFLFLGTQWPSGLALYWTISSIFAIYQQSQWQKTK